MSVPFFALAPQITGEDLGRCGVRLGLRFAYSLLLNLGRLNDPEMEL